MKRTKKELFEEVKDIPYELPEGWKWVRLEDISEKIFAGGDKPKNFSKTKTDIYNIPVFANSMRNNGLLGYTNKCKVDKPCITISARGTIGYTVVRKEKFYPAVRLIVLIPKENINLKFLNYVLHTVDIIKNGANIPQLTVPMVKKIVIPLPFKDGKPDFEKQKQIVKRIEALFKEIDKAIELRQKAIEETKKLFDSVLDGIFREAEKDKENWKWGRLGSIGRIFSGSSAPQDKKYFNQGKYPFIRVSDLGKYGKTTDLKECRDYINDLAVKEKKLVKARKGTIIFPKSGAAILTNNRGILGVDAYVVSHLACLEVHNDFDNHFVFYMLCNLDFSKIVNNSSYPSLTLKEIKEIRIPIPFKDGSPDLEVQKQIARYLDNLNNKIEQLEDFQGIQLEKFRQLKESILNKAFRGELM